MGDGKPISMQNTHAHFKHLIDSFLIAEENEILTFVMCNKNGIMKGKGRYTDANERTKKQNKLTN